VIAGLDPIGTIMDKASTILVYNDYKSPYASSVVSLLGPELRLWRLWKP